MTDTTATIFFAMSLYRQGESSELEPTDPVQRSGSAVCVNHLIKIFLCRRKDYLHKLDHTPKENTKKTICEETLQTVNVLNCLHPIRSVARNVVGA